MRIGFTSWFHEFFASANLDAHPTSKCLPTIWAFAFAEQVVSKTDANASWTERPGGYHRAGEAAVTTNASGHAA